MTLQNESFMPQVLEMIASGHTVSIVARGFSMRPFIEDRRDVLVFGKLTGSEIVGDVVLAEISKGHFVCHRIDAIDGKHVTLRGDGNYPGTEQCHREDLRARLIGIKRKGSHYDLTTSCTWRMYSKIWVALLPVRRWLLAIYRRLPTL